MLSKKVFTIVGFYSIVIFMFLLGTILGNRTVSVISEMLPVERKHHIILDAGHGGEDGGAISCSGKRESNINLQITLRLNDLFRLMGYDTIMIRTCDTAVYTQGGTIAQKKVSDLKQRVKIVSQTPNSLLISVHQNTFSESQYYGAQVFYAKNPESEELAKQLQTNFINYLNLKSNRKAKKASGIYIMDQISSPGVLIECGFLSNPQEEALLCTPEYQKNLCRVITACTASFLASS